MQQLSSSSGLSRTCTLADISESQRLPCRQFHWRNAACSFFIANLKKKIKKTSLQAFVIADSSVGTSHCNTLLAKVAPSLWLSPRHMNTCTHFKSMTFSWGYSLVICLSTVEPRSGTDGPARPRILLMKEWHGSCGLNGEQMVSISIGQHGPRTQSTIPDLCNSVRNATQTSLGAVTWKRSTVCSQTKAWRNRRTHDAFWQRCHPSLVVALFPFLIFIHRDFSALCWCRVSFLKRKCCFLTSSGCRHDPFL